jgi:hypothetical protein
MRLTKLLAVALLACALALTAAPAHAWRQPLLNEGLTNVLDGAAPPPGVYVSLYTLIRSSDEADVSETATTGVPGSALAPPDLENTDVSIAAIAPQVIWVSKYQLFGGNIGFDFFPILGAISLDAGKNNADVNRLFKASTSPVGDMYFGPFIAFHHMLGGPWQLHWVVECDAIAPIGDYDNTKALQFASNHWTVEPWVSFTLFGPMGLELSSRLHYTYNFTNDDFFTPGGQVEMQPGQVFHMNYAVTKEVCKNIRIGASGYYVQQLTEDEINGVGINNSEEEAFAVGPVVWWNKGPFIVEAKTHFDTYATNRPKAITGVLRLILPIF